MKKQKDGKQDEQLLKVQEELAELKAQSETLGNQLKRAVADYQNLEKRVSEGRAELTTWVSSELIKKLLPSLDHLERALTGASESEKQSGWLKGVELAAKQLRDVLKSEGLDEIEADGRFDPSLHEAVDTREGEDGMILEVAEKGYNLHGKILRPAKVVVGRRNNS